MGRRQLQRRRTVAVNGGRRSGGGWRWQVDARPKSVIGGGRRQQVAIAHCCILCRISPYLLCRLRRWRRWCRMTTRRRVGDLLHCRGCQCQRRRRRGGRWPACQRLIKYPPPYSTPLQHLHLLLPCSPLRTLRPASAVTITGDCGRRTTGLRRWAAAAEVAGVRLCPVGGRVGCPVGG